MGRIAERFAEAFRNYVTDGVPSSGANHPSKSEIRAIGTEIEQTLATTGLGAIYDTTSAGIAATTNGQLFLVRGTNGSFADLYKNVSGLAVSQNVSLPSTASVNIRPQSIATQGPRVIWDRHDLMGGGMNCIYWPLNSRAYDIVMGDDLANTVANAECEELLGYSKIVLSATDAAWALVLDMDTKLLAAMLFNDAKALLNSKPGRVKILISKWGETLDTTLDVVDLANAVGENLIANGRTMDGWDMTGVTTGGATGAYGPADGGYITGLGFTKWWQAGVAGGQVLVNWRSRSIRSRGEFGFVRMYVGLDAAVDLSSKVMQVHLFGDSGAYLATKDVPCERKLSDYEYVFAGRFIIDQDNVREIRVGLAAGVSGAAKAGLTGAQLYVGDREVYTIGLQDYPVCTASRRFAYPPYMFLTKGRPMPLFLPQIAQRKTDVLDLVGAFWSGGAGLETLPNEIEGDRLIIDPARILSGTAGIDLQPHDNPVRRLRMPITPVIGGWFGTGTVRPHFIGDSLTNREQPIRAAKKLEALGYTVQCVGSMMNGGGGSETAPLYGGEGREGIQWADYIYERTTYAAPVTDWAAYLAGNDEYKRVRNPYLFPATGSAPFVNNGYEFNFRKYLNRAGYPDPTKVIINLGRNDITYNPTLALGQMQRGFVVMLASIRAACPAAEIGFVFGGEGRTTAADADWDNYRWPMLLSLLGLVKAERDGGDSQVWVLPAYAHVTGQTGWGVADGGTDPETGTQTLSISDSTHMDPLPNDVARSQYAEVTSAFIHATTTQPSDNVLTGRETAVSFGGAAGSGVLWTNQPSAATFLLGSTRHITRLDLRRFKQVRLTANKQNNAGTAGAKLALNFNPANNYTLANFLPIGTSAVEVPVDGPAQIVTSGWVDLATAAKRADMLVGIIGTGGSGSVSPEFGSIIAEFR